MTARQAITQRPGASAPDIIQFPDRPEYEDMTTVKHFHRFGYLASLIRHFGNEETTVITSEMAAGVRATESYEGVRFPDLLIAFGVAPAAFDARNGYLIPEQGKPPDFVLEIASKSTAEKDATDKRNDYAAMGIPEYWRFDAEGSFYRGQRLAGDRLSVMGSGQYEPIAITADEAGNLRGHSEVLNLDLCWEDGRLRFWDPVRQRYLNTFDDTEEALEASEVAHRETEVALGASEAAHRETEVALGASEAARETAEAAREAAEAAQREAEARADRLEQERERERQALEERIRQLEQERDQ